MNECPACHQPVADEVKECPRCGIFFAKWRERETNIESGDLSRYRQFSKATSSEFNWTVLILFCVAILGVFYFLGQRAVEDELPPKTTAVP